MEVKMSRVDNNINRNELTSFIFFQNMFKSKPNYKDYDFIKMPKKSRWDAELIYKPKNKKWIVEFKSTYNPDRRKHRSLKQFDDVIINKPKVDYLLTLNTPLLIHWIYVWDGISILMPIDKETIKDFDVIKLKTPKLAYNYNLGYNYTENYSIKQTKINPKYVKNFDSYKYIEIFDSIDVKKV